MGVNLARAGKTVERYMLDTIRIVRPALFGFDPVTLAPVGTEQVIYEGKAFVSPMGDPQLTTLGEQEVQRTQYEIGIPRDSDAVILPNDIVRSLSSENPEMEGVTIYVHDTVDGTFFSHVRIKGFHDKPATGPEAP